MLIYGAISNGNSDRNEHVPRPQKSPKSTTTAVQASKGVAEAAQK